MNYNILLISLLYMSDENKDSLVSLGKLLKFKQKGEKILSNLTSFQIDKINNKEQLFFCEGRITKNIKFLLIVME